MGAVRGRGGQGLKTDTGPVVKVGKGSPGSPKPLTHEPDQALKPVTVPKPGSATVTAGKGFQAAGSLPIAVADAATGEAVVAPVREAERLRREAAARPVPGQDKPVAGSASSVNQAWLDGAKEASGTPSPKPAPAPVDRKKESSVSKQAVASGTSGAASSAPAPDPVASTSSEAAAPAGGSVEPVTVTTLDPNVVAAAGGRFLGFTVARASGGAAPVSVSVDYSGLADAYGGNFGGRLRLVSLPACAATTPQAPECQVGTPVVSVNDPTSQKITAVVSPAAVTAATTTSGTESAPPASLDKPADAVVQGAAFHPVSGKQPVQAGAAASAASAVLALESSSSSSAGSYSATGLQASMAWDVGEQTGTFTYGLDLPFVPSPAGDEPELGLQYSSADVDGMTSTENPQSSEAGAGWRMNTPFIERRYAPCKDGSGNLCWTVQNATLNLDGHSGQLVWWKDAGSDTDLWRMENDQGWKVEQVQPGNTQNPNGDANGEYWKITDTEGTKYYFGREKSSYGPATNSTMTMPLYGQKDGDTCWPQANHMCFKAWRWNLAYIVDAHGNLQRYTWEKDRAAYRTVSSSKAQAYDTSAHLSSVEYGFTTATATSPAPARTVISYKWRCTAGASCQGPTVDPASWYPDVPFDLWCKETASTCSSGPKTPVFFGFKKIDKIKSQTWSGTGTTYNDVEQLNLDHNYPAKSGTPTTMFMYAATRSGLSGTRIDLPSIRFQETFLDNRWKPGSKSPIARPRIGTIQNEFGGRVAVTYGQPDACDSQSLDDGAEDDQTTNCYARYDDEGAKAWYRKWLVTKVEVVDAYGAPTQTTSYEYDTKASGGDGAGWHSDNEPEKIVPKDRQLWSDFRGYRKVKVHQGTDPATWTTEEFRFFRGLDGDHTIKSGQDATLSVTLYTSESTDTATSRMAFVDSPGLSGQVFEHRIRRADGTEVSAEITTYDRYVFNGGVPGPFGIQHHPVVFLNAASQLSMTAMGGVARARKHSVKNAYEHIWGRKIWTQDDGDAATGIGPSCDYTVYGGWDGTEWVPDMNAWVIDAPRQQLSTSTACPATITDVPTANLIGREDLYYGENWTDLTTAPSTSNVTKTVEYSDASTPFKHTATRYDARGRVTGQIGPDNFITTATSFATAGLVKSTAYTETNGLVTGTVETSETGSAVTTTTNPGRQSVLSSTDANGRITRLSYDSLGRLLTVRLPGDDFDVKAFTYTVSNTAPSSVRTDEYPAAGATPVSTVLLLDTQGRTYQKQVAGPNGQRIVSGTRYDGRGNPAASVAAFGASGTLATPVPDWYAGSFTDTIPSSTVTAYDDVNRSVSQSQVAAGRVTKWTTSTSYDGLSTTTTPPSNGSASEPDLAATTVTNDVLGRPVSRVEGGKSTKYGYDIAGNLVAMTSPLGKITRYGYDWLGQRTSTDDPDSGASTSDYYPSGKVRHSRDAKGQDLFTTVDVVGRLTATYAGTDTTGTKLSEIVYDGVPLGASAPLKGLATSQTSYTDGHAYTEAFGYDERDRIVRTDRTIPSVPGSPIAHLAGTYTTTSTFDGLDRKISVTYPAVGGLDAETVTTGYNNAYATTLTSPLGTYVGNTGYTDSGLLASRILGVDGARGSVKRVNTWDESTGRLTTQAAVTPSGAGQANVQDDTYTYAPTGQVTKITDSVAGQQQCYAYDGRNRLVGALSGAASSATGTACSADTTGPAPYQETYAYDDDGNLTGLTSAGTTATYGYGANTGLGLSGGPHAPTTVTRNGATATYTYDANGKLTRRVDGTVSTTFTWNSLGHLTGVSDDKGTSRFVSGPDNSRWIRATPTETVAYLDGQELHVAAGATAATAIRYYSHAGTIVAVRKSGPDGGLSWSLGDRQGSATVSVDAGTGATTRDRYLPYGGNRDTGGRWTLPTDRGWLGQTRDTDTGLTYLNARYYDPALAHFISTDPLADQTSPQHANPYGYAAANPITYTDPAGLWALKMMSSAGKVAMSAANSIGKVVFAAPGHGLGKGYQGTKAPAPKASKYNNPNDVARPGYKSKAPSWFVKWVCPECDPSYNKARLRAIGAYAGAQAVRPIWPHASRNYLHYLSAKGAALRQDIDAALRDVKSFREMVDDDVKDLASRAVSTYKQNDPAGKNGAVTFPISTGWHRYSFGQEESQEWFLALASVKYTVLGQVTVYPPDATEKQWKYEVNYIVSVRDRYNFDPGKDADIIPGINVSDADMADLHARGLAQEYDVYGSSSVKTKRGAA